MLQYLEVLKAHGRLLAAHYRHAAEDYTGDGRPARNVYTAPPRRNTLSRDIAFALAASTSIPPLPKAMLHRQMNLTWGTPA